MWADIAAEMATPLSVCVLTRWWSVARTQHFLLLVFGHGGVWWSCLPQSPLVSGTCSTVYDSVFKSGLIGLGLGISDVHFYMVYGLEILQICHVDPNTSCISCTNWKRIFFKQLPAARRVTNFCSVKICAYVCICIYICMCICKCIFSRSSLNFPSWNPSAESLFGWPTFPIAVLSLLMVNWKNKNSVVPLSSTHWLCWLGQLSEVRKNCKRQIKDRITPHVNFFQQVAKERWRWDGKGRKETRDGGGSVRARNAYWSLVRETVPCKSVVGERSVHKGV